ncbi:Ribosomal RNA small subunit methyltransferase E [gamma proteobacterium IMCC2047]|nr:Ribosomal RNA small subunit methyltransferase E [gamma proteobacterium IMCC2047]
MRIPRIFIDLPLNEHQQVELPRETSHYLNRVLRLPVDAQLRVFNGQGGEYQAQICAANKNAVSLAIGAFSAEDNSSPLHIHLGIALSKGDRMDFVVQKATELGIKEISLLYSERTEVKLKGEREEKRLQHWQKVAISACEQCASNHVPTIHAPTPLNQWLEERHETVKLIMQPGTDQPFKQDNPGKVALLVGPEGGFSESEVNAANQAGFNNLSLGPRILRTETAPLVAISILQHHWGDLR